MISTIRIIALLAAGVAAGSLLAGCAAAPQSGSPPPEPAAANGAPAPAARGPDEEAASAWIEEAASDPARAPTFRLRAAQAWWRAGQGARAAEVAQSIDPAALEPEDRTRHALLLTRIALTGPAAREAFGALPPLDDLLALPEPAPALELAVQAAQRAVRPLDEVRFRAALDPRLADPAANRMALWNLVRSLPPGSLSSSAARFEAAAAGWVELGAIELAHRTDFPAFSAAVRDWRQRHAGHPAAALVPQLLDRVRREGSPPRHVALLLPLSGTFAAAAAAVRDGFLAGWYAADGDRPVVSVYDTEAEGPETAFRTAIAEGADFVVGPLRKKAVARVAALDGRTAPLLVLNALDTRRPPRDGGGGGRGSHDSPPVYRFALAPEDEARALADFASRNGHTRAGLLVPDTEWGARVAAAFTGHWEASGGTVAGRSPYRGAAEDLVHPVRELLSIDTAAARARRPRRVVERSFAGQPLPGVGLDFVFLAGFPREARLLRPQITFLRATDLPVYSTSHVFTGVLEPQHDVDLEGIVFSDMPWVLDQPSTRENDLLRERIVALWPAANEGFTRYYAFGIDAYRLQARIHHLAAHPYEVLLGHTGRLTVGPDHEIRIEMAWARFQDGIPVPLLPPAT